MNASELRDLSVNELKQKGKELRDELWGARIRRATEQLENTALLGQLKKDIARVETFLAEKRAAANTTAGQGA